MFLVFDTMLGPVQLLLVAVFFTLVCNGATLFGLLSTRPARRLSAISYSLYLMQGLALTLVFAVPPVRDFAMSGPVRFWLNRGLLRAAASGRLGGDLSPGREAGDRAGAAAALPAGRPVPGHGRPARRDGSIAAAPGLLHP